jgi:hypothetical protein
MLHANAELEIILAEKYVRQMGFHDALLPEPAFGDLNNEIHHIFAPQNWPLEDLPSGATKSPYGAP